ncbi:hypothetical protein BDY24DRAFT_415243 [Mrakia frigida]|uniref:uncharacterized protein n=1 Tax=Mrakia frigida TaxID=29902 RepID=UPI003FCC06C6
MSDYEAQRLANIAANRAMMEKLGIKRTTPPPPPPKPAPKKRAPPAAPLEASRKSSRISLAPRPSYADNSKDVSARQLSHASGSRSSSRHHHHHRNDHRSGSQLSTTSSSTLNSRSNTDRDSRSFSPPPSLHNNGNGNEIREPRKLRKLPAPPPPPLEVPTLTAERPTWVLEEGQERGYWKFEEGYEGFTPNLSPEELMRFGSFGGMYWRSFYSSILDQDVPEDFTEFPAEWYRSPDIDDDTYLTSQDYLPHINRYKIKASQSIEDWEKQGWIRAQDPRGWCQWYFRFFLGRRTEDDARQISRWAGCAGPRGRFKTALIKRITESKNPEGWDDYTISPIHRQTIQHWAVILTKEDFEAVAGPIGS